MTIDTDKRKSGTLLRLFSLLLTMMLAATSLQAQPTSTKLELTYPTDGEVFEPGDTVLIEWTGTNIPGDTLEMDLSVDGGGNWSPVARFPNEKGTSDPTTSYRWVVPSIACTDCSLRLRQVNGNFGNGELLDSFALDFQYPVRKYYLHKWVTALSDFDTTLIIRNDTVITSWDIRTGRKISELNLTDKNMAFGTDLSFSRVGPFMTVAAKPFYMDGRPTYSQVYLWNYRTGEIEAVIEGRAYVFFGDQYGFSGASFSPDESRLIMAGAGPAKIWDRSTRQFIDSFPQTRFNSTSSSIEAAVFSPDGTTAVIGTRAAIEEYDLSTLEKTRSFDAFTTYLQFSSNGKYLLTNGTFEHAASGFESYRLFDAATLTQLTFHEADDSYRVPMAQISSAGTRLVATSTIVEVIDPWRAVNRDYYKHGLSIDHFISLSASGMTMVALSPDASIYVYDISGKPADTMEGTFSISGQLPNVLTFFVGNAEVGTPLDTLVASYVMNGGTEPVRIDAVEIASGHTGDFTITANGGPYDLAPGASAPIGVRFTPGDTGLRAAVVDIRTEHGTVQGALSGFGVTAGVALPTIVAATFGGVPVGSERTTTFPSFLTNNTDIPLQIDEVVLLSGQTSDFSIVSGDGPYTLTPGASAPIEIRFVPSDTGLRAVMVEARTANGAVQARISGRGISEGTGAVVTTGDDGEARAVRLHPNPATGQVAISCRLREPAKVTLLIHDLMGRDIDRVDLGHYSAGDQTFGYDVQGLAAGTYRLEIRTENGSVECPLTVVR